MAHAAVVAIGENGWTASESSLLAERATSAYGYHKPWWHRVSFFHRDGSRYEVSAAVPARALPPFSRLLAATVYNPAVIVRYEYRRLGPYELSELKRALLAAIDKDDDVLTQFHEPETLKRRVESATSFDEVAEVLDFAATDPDAA